MSEGFARKREVGNPGCGITAFIVLGLGCLLVHWVLGVVFICFGVLYGAVAKSSWICSACGNAVTAQSRLCPTCRAEFLGPRRLMPPPLPQGPPALPPPDGWPEGMPLPPPAQARWKSIFVWTTIYLLTALCVVLAFKFAQPVFDKAEREGAARRAQLETLSDPSSPEARAVIDKEVRRAFAPVSEITKWEPHHVDKWVLVSFKCRNSAGFEFPMDVKYAWRNGAWQMEP